MTGLKSCMIVLFCWLTGSSKAQFESLTKLGDHQVKLFVSKGCEKRAGIIGLRVDRALEYYGELLQFRPDVTLLVLTEQDWPKFTSYPVYGMPHYTGEKMLVVAATDNAFWKSFIPPMDQLPPALAEQLRKVYRNERDSLSMEAFFDLLAIHELGHALHFQGGLLMQRRWMEELYANILLHTYVAEKEPGQLPALTLFPQMVISGSARDFKFISLEDLHEKYSEITQQYPRNYGWYQSRWHVAAGRIYDAAGPEIGRKIWDALINQKKLLTDTELPGFFERTAHKSVADMMRNWDQETRR